MSDNIPKSCDYLVVGAGATGMAFCDSLLLHNSTAKIIFIDTHTAPGGHWHDSYDFVQLHQPSSLYGVESTKLEPPQDNGNHLATRREILDYYRRVQTKWEDTGRLFFVGESTFDFSSKQSSNTYVLRHKDQEITVQVRQKLVDARFLQPDLPIDTPPKFKVSKSIHCVPVNALAKETPSSDRYYVVIGAGKTGMDAILYLLQNGVERSKILWIMPCDVWITARENMGNCMEFLHDAVTSDNKKLTKSDNNWMQDTFKKWEQQGKVYRLDSHTRPTKFRDATLSKEEVSILQSINTIRGSRIVEIRDNGDMSFQDGRVVPLPWKNAQQDTTFVHCSAGAFHYTKQDPDEHHAIFQDGKITIQEVYGTPGFCFNGALIGLLEALQLTNEKKNQLTTLRHAAPKEEPLPLGPSGGDVDMSFIQGYVQRLVNLKKWIQVPEIRDWLVGNRLFNLGHRSVEEMTTMVNETSQRCQDLGLLG